jgi:hypothetical protein
MQALLEANGLLAERSLLGWAFSGFECGYLSGGGCGYFAGSLGGGLRARPLSAWRGLRGRRFGWDNFLWLRRRRLLDQDCPTLRRRG